MFSAHMTNDKIAEELLAQTRTPQEVYEYAIRREKGIEHSKTMKFNPLGGNQFTPKQEPVNYINKRGRANYSGNQNIQRGRGARGRPFQRGSQNNRGQQRATNTGNQKQCYKCGNQYCQNHLQSCPAKDKICAKCAKRGHFAKVCRSSQVNYLEDTQIGQQEETDTESLETENDPVAFAEFSSNNGWNENPIDNFSIMAIAESFEIKNTSTLIEDNLNGHIVKLKTNFEHLFAIADSGSPMSFLKEKTARRIQQHDKHALFKNIPSGDTAQNLACYNGETIVPKGRLIITIESGGWKIQSDPFIVVDDKKANIIGRNLLPQIDIKLIQEQNTEKVHAIREQEESDSAIKQGVKDNYTQLCVRIGKSKNHTMKTQFNEELEPIQQKGRRIPIHLQERVETELNKLIDQKHIIKLDKCSEREFISPIVITVKKDQTVKLIEFKENQQIHS